MNCTPRMYWSGILEQRGRHRYYRLAGPDVGELLEVIARVAPPSPVRSLTQGTRAEALRRARTCYDHLAGRLGVALMDAFLERGVIDAWLARAPKTRAVLLTEEGRAGLRCSFGIVLD